MYEHNRFIVQQDSPEKKPVRLHRAILTILMHEQVNNNTIHLVHIHVF